MEGVLQNLKLWEDQEEVNAIKSGKSQDSLGGLDLAGYIGKRLSHYRQLRGWSQQEVSRRAKFSRTGYANIELGNTLPQMDTLISMADVLGVKLFDLLPENLWPQIGQLTTEELQLLRHYRSIDPIGQEYIYKFARNLADDNDG